MFAGAAVTCQTETAAFIFHNGHSNTLHPSISLCLTPVKLLSACHATSCLLSALVTPRLKEHRCDVSAPDNELRVLAGTETAARRRLLLRLTAQMSSSWKWQAGCEESNDLLLHHCPQLSCEFIIIMLALFHCSAASKVSINPPLSWSAALCADNEEHFSCFVQVHLRNYHSAGHCSGRMSTLTESHREI